MRLEKKSRQQLVKDFDKAHLQKDIPVPIGWICLACGAVYPSQKAQAKCRCKIIFSGTPMSLTEEW